MALYAVYQQGIGITPEINQIESGSLTSAKKEASQLFSVKGRWAKTQFTDINNVQRSGWVKGQSGWDYGSYPRIYMYEV